MANIVDEGIRSQRGQTVKALKSKGDRAVDEMKSVYIQLSNHKSEVEADQTLYTQEDIDIITSYMNDIVTTVTDLLNQIQ